MHPCSGVGEIFPFSLECGLGKELFIWKQTRFCNRGNVCNSAIFIISSSDILCFIPQVYIFLKEAVQEKKTKEMRKLYAQLTHKRGTMQGVLKR